MPESTELTISPRRNGNGRSATVKPNAADRARWFLFRKHIVIEEIAKRHGVTVQKVQTSIDRMESYNAQNSNELVDMRMNELVLNQADQMEKALAGALNAEVIIRRPNAKNPNKSVIVSRDPDYKTRLEALGKATDLAASLRPKGGGVNIAVQQNTGVVADSARRLTFEERLRQIRQEHGMRNDANVADAEYTEVDESAEQFEEGDGDEESAEA
jgi:hypothetical protein